MNSDNNKTSVYYQKMEVAESIQEADEIIDKIKERHSDENWKNYFSFLRKEKKIKIKERIRKKCFTKIDKYGNLEIVSRNTFNTWYEEPPKKRRDVICLCRVLELTLEETNKVLERYARQSKIYIKNPDDLIYTYLFNNNLPFEKYYDYKKELNRALADYDIKRQKKLTDEVIDRYDTTVAFILTKEAEDFRKFLENEKILETLYARNDKLIKYIKSQIEVMILDEEKLNLRKKSIRKYVKVNYNSTEEKEVYWNQRKISELKRLGISANNKEKNLQTLNVKILDRDSLIALGVSFNFNIDQINKLLEITYNEKLCSKYVPEILLVYVLTEIEMYCPDIFNHNSFFERYESQDTPIEVIEELIYTFNNIDEVKKEIDKLKNYEDLQKEYMKKIAEYNSMGKTAILGTLIEWRIGESKYSEDFFSSELYNKLCKVLKLNEK